MTTPGNRSGSTSGSTKSLAEPPVMRVVGHLDGMPVLKAPWLDGSKPVSNRLLNQLDDLGITIEDNPSDYVL